MISAALIILISTAVSQLHSTEACNQHFARLNYGIQEVLHYPDGSAARTVYCNNLMNDFYKLYGAGVPSLLRVEDLDLIGGDLVPERVTKDGLYSTGSGLSLQYLWREKYLHGDTAGNIKMDNFYNSSKLQFGRAGHEFRIGADYDREGRLAATDYRWGDTAPPFAEYDYRYDRAGNRTGMTVTDLAGSTPVIAANTYYYNDSNRMDLERRAGHWRDYAYDEQGNMTSNPEHEYSYDHFGRLVQVDRGAIKFIYSLSGDKLIKIGPGNLVTAYFYGGGSEVLYEAEYKDTETNLEPVGNDYYIYSDTGLVAQFSGTPSGAPGFVSRFYDSDVGLYQLGARWYDPNIGRFVSPDPIPSSLNQYAYANNNPFRFQDANGLFPKRVQIEFSSQDLKRETSAHQYINMSGIYASMCADCGPVEQLLYNYNIASWLPPLNITKGQELSGRGMVYLEDERGLLVSDFFYSMEAGMGPTPIPDEAIPMMMLGSMRFARYLKSEIHHPITYKIWKVLEEHQTLAGKFKYKDPSYAFPSNPGRHRGYCDLLHRSIENEIIPWLGKHPYATPEKFLEKMNKIYSRKEIQEAVPNVNMRWKDPSP